MNPERLGVVCRNYNDRLRGPPFVAVEDPAQPLMALNIRIHVDRTARPLDQPIVESLMIPLEVIRRLTPDASLY